jgi:hypothetical protein
VIKRNDEIIPVFRFAKLVGIAEPRYGYLPEINSSIKLVDMAKSNSPTSTPKMLGNKPQLQIHVPSVAIPTTHSPILIESPSSQEFGFSPVDGSMRELLLYTIGMLPDDVLSPSTWRMHAYESPVSSPLSLSYLVSETGVTVEITGYDNGQYVVRLLGPQMMGENESALISVNLLGKCFGERCDVPAWKVRESLMERINYNHSLD